MKKEVRGIEVQTLQAKLNQQSAALKFDMLVVDGIFGEKTETALMTVKGVKEITLSAYDLTETRKKTTEQTGITAYTDTTKEVKGEVLVA